MKNIKIIKATDCDFSFLTELLYELDKYHYSESPGKYRSPEEMNEKRIEKDVFSLYESGAISVFYATFQGKVIGMVSGSVKEFESIVSKPKVVGFINELVVLPECRGTECARLLMGEIEQYFSENGAVEFGLHVAGFNKRAISFYDKLGYSLDAQLLTKDAS